MKKIAFDNDKYIALQSEKIEERISYFDIEDRIIELNGVEYDVSENVDVKIFGYNVKIL